MNAMSQLQTELILAVPTAKPDVKILLVASNVFVLKDGKRLMVERDVKMNVNLAAIVTSMNHLENAPVHSSTLQERSAAVIKILEQHGEILALPALLKDQISLSHFVAHLPTLNLVLRVFALRLKPFAKMEFASTQTHHIVASAVMVIIMMMTPSSAQMRMNVSTLTSAWIMQNVSTFLEDTTADVWMDLYLMKKTTLALILMSVKMQQLVLMVDAPTLSVVLSAIVSKGSNQSTVEKHAKILMSVNEVLVDLVSAITPLVDFHAPVTMDTK
jgi:hypothetical protein